jgi:hypothetical protein
MAIILCIGPGLRYAVGSPPDLSPRLCYVTYVTLQQRTNIESGHGVRFAVLVGRPPDLSPRRPRTSPMTYVTDGRAWFYEVGLVLLCRLSAS